MKTPSKLIPRVFMRLMMEAPSPMQYTTSTLAPASAASFEGFGGRNGALECGNATRQSPGQNSSKILLVQAKLHGMKHL